MSDTVAVIALVLTITSLLLLALAIIITAYRDGSLKADLKFVKRYVAIHYRHMKTRFINN